MNLNLKIIKKFIKNAEVHNCINTKLNSMNK